MPSKQESKERPVIVQFIHPGREFPVENKSGKYPVAVPWVGGACSDCDGHSRRLVSHKGDYVDGNGRKKTAQLAFWTEWEACTVANVLPATKRNQLDAHWVHMVKTPLVKHPGTLNTDPCVFGSAFKYCLCQQKKNNRLRRLSPNSLILFGSKIDGDFYLDTLFVVGEHRIKYDASFTESLPVSKEYQELTLKRIGSGELTFYRGITFDADIPGEMYSFVPARPFGPDDFGCGERFKLDVSLANRFIPSQFGQLDSELGRFHHNIQADKSTVIDVWNEILRQVREAGFVPGVHFDWPTK